MLKIGKKDYLVLLSLFFSFVPPVFSQFWGESWEVLESRPFWVFYQNGDLKNAQQVLQILEVSSGQLSREIGYNVKTPAGVFLCPSQEMFDKIMGEDFPRWGEGVAAPTKNIIILKSPRWSKTNSQLKEVVTHELTHILVNEAVDGAPIPRWLNEGLAVHFSGEKDFASSSLVSKALLSNSIIPLDEIDEVLTFHKQKAQLAYQESYIAVEYLIDISGMQAVQAILAELRSGNNVNDAFLKTIGRDFWDFETEWYTYIKKKYRWHFLMDFNSYLWMIILLLFFIVFIGIRQRNKRILRQWEDEWEEGGFDR